MQKIILPWNSRRWHQLKSKICAPINSIVELDNTLTSICTDVRPRTASDMFTQYFAGNATAQEHFLLKVLPHLQKMIADGQKTFRRFVPRVGGANTNIVLNRPQVATLIICAWFGLLDYKYIAKGPATIDDMPDIHKISTNVYSMRNIAVFQCMMEYFNKVYTYMASDEHTRAMFCGGCIIIKWKTLEQSPDWITSSTPINGIIIGDGENAKMQVVNAHEYIGGDLFRGSLTPEEITMIMYPESIICLLFCPKLKPNETVTLLGAEKFSQCAGFGTNVKFLGSYNDTRSRGYSKDETETILQFGLIFMNASPRTGGKAQYCDDFPIDLNKAYCGMSSITAGGIVAADNWSYGFNGNNLQIKFIQLLLAAAQSGKRLEYKPISGDFEALVTSFVEWIVQNTITVGELYNLYLRVIEDCYAGPNTRLNELNLFESIMDKLDEIMIEY